MPNLETEKSKLDTSCVNSLTRQEFLKLVLKRGTMVSAFICLPKIVDRFLVPPAHAMMPTGSCDTIMSMDSPPCPGPTG